MEYEKNKIINTTNIYINCGYINIININNIKYIILHTKDFAKQRYNTPYACNII